MEINKLKKAAAIAKSRTNDKRWLAAIDKAIAGVENGGWIVTELVGKLAITTESGQTYFSNGVCQCASYVQGGKAACKHRALYRLYEIARELPEVATPATSGIAGRATSREEIIADIKAAWPTTWPPLAVELMARFRVNQLEMLDADMLRRVSLAIAM